MPSFMSSTSEKRSLLPRVLALLLMCRGLCLVKQGGTLQHCMEHWQEMLQEDWCLLQAGEASAPHGTRHHGEPECAGVMLWLPFPPKKLRKLCKSEIRA